MIRIFITIFFLALSTTNSVASYTEDSEICNAEILITGKAPYEALYFKVIKTDCSYLNTKNIYESDVFYNEKSKQKALEVGDRLSFKVRRGYSSEPDQLTVQADFSYPDFAQNAISLSISVK